MATKTKDSTAIEADPSVRDEDVQAVFKVMIAQVESRAKALGHSDLDSQGVFATTTSSASVTSTCKTCGRGGVMRTGEEPSGPLVIERCAIRR